MQFWFGLHSALDWQSCAPLGGPGQNDWQVAPPWPAQHTWPLLQLALLVQVSGMPPVHVPFATHVMDCCFTQQTCAPVVHV